MAARLETENQVDFSGGANGQTPPVLLQPSEVQRLINGFAMPGGGVESRKGYKVYSPDTNRGVGIYEFEQSVGTILTYKSVGPNWYDETMQPYFEIFQQTPAVNDAIYFGAREKFGQIILYTPDLALSPPVGDNVFQFQFWNGTTWVDETASVVESMPNSKQMRGAAGEWIFTYPEQSAWVPNQVETRTYQYWRRIIKVSDGGTPNMGTNIVQSRRHVRGDWVGRRHLLTAFSQGLTERPGLTLTPVSFEIYNQVTNRVRTAQINDYFYIASDGQKPLRRWNGSRGPTRSGTPQIVVNAGLTAPTAAPVLTPAANPNGYPLTYVLGFCISFEYGPESKLGESPPSPIAYVPAQAAAYQVTVGVAAAIAQAVTLDVNAIRIYATYDLAGKLVSERGSLSNYLLIARIEKADANWNAGGYVDVFSARVKVGQRNPILYQNTPQFYPKYIAVGAERLWIANDRFVACSDIGRGDSWNPENTWRFPNIRAIYYWDNQLLVFHSDDISYIRDVNLQLPDVGYFWRGIGLAQPDTIAVGEGQLHFVSPEGPARIIGSRVELTARGRAWEDPNYWNETAPNRSLASAAYFQGRIWFGVDNGGAGPSLAKMATLDLGTQGPYGWAEHSFAGVKWGTLANVHCPLDHPEARKRVLLGIPDGTSSSNYKKLCILEYGTSDDWVTFAYDGALIQTTVLTRELAVGGADRVKEYVQAHLKIRNQKAAGSVQSPQTTCQMIGSGGEANSTSLSLVASTAAVDQEWRFCPTDSGGGRHRGHGSALNIVATSETGFRLVSWLARASLDEWRPGP